jgi:hypothetical protein
VRAAEFKRRIYKVSTGCWLWHGAHIPAGYGHLKFDGSNQLAHRVSWQIHNGPIADGLFVLHKCDVKGCVNPSHLFLGTASDNVKDLFQKGLASRRGTKNPRVLIREQDVKDIRASTESTKELALKYGVSYFGIWNIRKGRTWSHVK